MRAVLMDGVIPVNHILWATGLNLFFFGLIVAWFYHTFNMCKEKGMLVRVGE
jgi:ABC-2 type transport system permease protein